VYFNQGQYNPQSREGKRLLGHELVHVVQQSRGKKQAVQKKEVQGSHEEKQTPSNKECSNIQNGIDSKGGIMLVFAIPPIPKEEIDKYEKPQDFKSNYPFARLFELGFFREKVDAILQESWKEYREENGIKEVSNPPSWKKIKNSEKDYKKKIKQKLCEDKEILIWLREKHQNNEEQFIIGAKDIAEKHNAIGLNENGDISLRNYILFSNGSDIKNKIIQVSEKLNAICNNNIKINKIAFVTHGLRKKIMGRSQDIGVKDLPKIFTPEVKRRLANEITIGLFACLTGSGKPVGTFAQHLRNVISASEEKSKKNVLVFSHITGGSAVGNPNIRVYYGKREMYEKPLGLSDHFSNDINIKTSTFDATESASVYSKGYTDKFTISPRDIKKVIKNNYKQPIQDKLINALTNYRKRPNLISYFYSRDKWLWDWPEIAKTGGITKEKIIKVLLREYSQKELKQK
jgi:hypothetical protein